MTTNKDGVISGFYYDQQITNPILMVGLYPNQKWKPNEDGSGGVWSDVSKSDGEEYPSYTDSTGKTITPPPYSETPICTSIITDEFQVSIANTFSDFGGDPIGEMWNSYKPMAPYISEISKGLQSISKTTDEWLNKEHNSGRESGDLFSRGVEALGKLAGQIGNSQQNMAQYLSRSLVVQGTRFSYYSGTGIDFGNLQMKFTVFSQYNIDGKFETVDDQIKKILPYVIGEFKKVDELGDGEVGQFISEFASWQMPPGNFTADLKNVDVVQKGTLKLRIGPYFALENMVISGCQLQYSKALIKDPTSDKVSMYPMSCEVTLVLKPVTKFSRNSLERFIFGRASKISRASISTDIEKDYVKIEAQNNSLENDTFS